MITCAFGLLDLPAELRNKIYAAAFGKSQVWIDHGYMDNENFLQHHPSDKTVEDDIRLNSKLLFVCKQVHHEATRFLYTNVEFCFKDARVGDTFLTRTRSSDLRAIERLNLSITIDNKTAVTWIAVLQNMSRQMSGIRHLTIYLNATSVTQKPIRESVLGTLANIAPRKLDNVGVTCVIQEERMTAAKARDVARKVEDQLLTPEARARRDVKESKMVYRDVRNWQIEHGQRRTRVLSIKDVPQTMAGVVKEKTKRVGLDQYHAVDTSAMCTAERYQFYLEHRTRRGK